MTKNEFMCILRANLNNFSTEEVSEILYDYEEHFNIGAANGKSEAEIIEELGDPRAIASQYSSSKSSSEMYTFTLSLVCKSIFSLILILFIFISFLRKVL